MDEMTGVDIGAGSVKVVKLAKENKKLFLEAIGEAKSPNSDWFAADKKSKTMEEMAEAVKTLLSDLKIRDKKVVTCLPEAQVVSRLIRLPPLKESEIKDALRFEAETFIPYPLDQVSIDYEVVEEDESGRLAVFAIAAKNDLITVYIKLFKSLGLELVALESPAIGLRRVINYGVKTGKNIIVVDMGQTFSQVVGLKEGKIVFTRSLSIGGESLTRAISINLGLDMASAEEYKKAYGLQESELEGKIRKAIETVFNSMAEELRKAVVLFSEETGRNVDVLVLSGGGANLPGLAEELTKLLGMEVQVIQPFVKIDTSRVQLPVDLNVEGCRFTLAAGLALREMI